MSPRSAFEEISLYRVTVHSISSVLVSLSQLYNVT